MKVPSLILLALAPLALAVDSRHSYVSEYELQGFGDFNGDGLLDAVVVDRATGNYRVGTQNAGGSLDWSKPCPSGVEGADAIAVGRVTSTTEDQLLVAGLLANRANLLEPCAQPASPTALELEGVGPNDVVAVDVNFVGNDPAYDDIIVITAFNGIGATGNEIQLAAFQSLPGGIALITEGPAPDRQRRSTRVFPAENTDPWVGALVFDDTDGSEKFVLSNAQTPTVEDTRELLGFAEGTDYLAAPLMSGAANQLVFWLPGSPTLRVSQITSGPTLNPVAEHDLGAPVEAVYVVEEPSGLALFITFGDGATGTFYDLDAAGAPIAGASVTAPTGERIGGVLGYAAGELSMLLAPANGGASTRAQHFAHDGTGWARMGGENLPAVGSASALTNVFLYDGEPFVDPDAKMVQTLHVSDWTSALVVTGGANPTASVVAETYGGRTAGLGGAATQPLGAVATGATDGLAASVFDQASITVEGGALGLALPSVTIDPPAGEYDRHVAAKLVTDADRAYYRFGGNPIWIEFEAGDPDRPITSPFNGLEPFTVYYYAESDSGARSPIHRADYIFAGEPGTIDSDGDGVPDYVELASGLDPTGGADSDGDGFSDLVELLQGSDPDDDTSVPATASDPVELGGLFDLALKPLSHDGIPGGGAVNASWAASNVDQTPTNVRVHSLESLLLGHATTEINDGDDLVGPSALIEGIASDGADLFVIAGTDPHFDTKPDDDTASGRELLKLVPVPYLTPPAVPPLDSPTPADDGLWVTGAQAYYDGLERTLVQGSITFRDSLDILVYERIIGILIALRAPAFPLDEATLTPFRDPSLGVELDAETLLRLQDYTSPSDPGYLLHDLFEEVVGIIDNDPEPRVTNLKELAAQLYQISAANGDADPGAYPNPFDTLRAFLRGEPLPSSYAAEITLSASQLSSAADMPAFIAPQLTPRPTETYVALVTPASFESEVPVLRDTAGGGSLRLFDATGSAFVFPRGIDLPAGSIVEILAFTDRDTLPQGAGEAVEAISATLTSIPQPPRQDRNRDLIDDAWGDHFFGGDPVAAFRDPDGDGYSTFQEMLENTDPTNGGSRPAAPAMPLGPPRIDIEPVPGGELRVFVYFPTRYADEVGFVLLADSGRAIRFDEQPGAPAPDGFDTFGLQFAPPAGAATRLFRFRMFLR